MTDTTTEAPVCDSCGAPSGMHKLACPTLAALRAALGEPPGANATVDGERDDEARLEEQARFTDDLERGLREIDEEPAFDFSTLTTDDQVLGHLARCVEEEAILRTAANRAKNALAAAHKRTTAATEHAAAHYARSRQIEMDLSTGGTEPEGDV